MWRNDHFQYLKNASFLTIYMEYLIENYEASR